MMDVSNQCDDGGLSLPGGAPGLSARSSVGLQRMILDPHGQRMRPCVAGSRRLGPLSHVLPAEATEFSLYIVYKRFQRDRDKTGDGVPKSFNSRSFRRRRFER